MTTQVLNKRIERSLFEATCALVKGGEPTNLTFQVSSAAVQYFQGIPDYCIIGYTLKYWDSRPETESDLALGKSFIHPDTEQEVFYLSALARPMQAFLIDGYCREDFLSNLDRQTVKWNTFESLFVSYIPYQDQLFTLEEKDGGICQVTQEEKFNTSVNHYLTHGESKLTYVKVQGEDRQLIEMDNEFTGRQDMIRAALAHFAEHN